MQHAKVSVGVIGCGVISDAYFEILKTFEILDVVACADLNRALAVEKAALYQIRVCSVEELLSDATVEIVVNLTTPDAHAEIGLAALQAGKSLYNEKPLAISRQDAWRLIEVARAHGVLLGSAPDTFMGGGIQTCRKLIDEGVIGQPVGASAVLLNHGPESWHPRPQFYYQPGGGPLFDMGPYYLTALVTLLGPVQRVVGLTKQTFPERTIRSQPQSGKKIAVAVPTYVSGMLEFVGGMIGTITTSFDVWATEAPTLEIYGTEGTLSLSDPSFFDGPVRLWQPQTCNWGPVALTHGYSRPSRGIGVADMAYALRTGRQHRACGELAYHILDIMHAIYDSAREGSYKELQSMYARPAPLLSALPAGILDD